MKTVDIRQLRKWSNLLKLALFTLSILVASSSQAGTLWDVESVVTPVDTARRWGSATSPNARGGSNFIVPFYNYPSSNPVEWVVVDLSVNTYNIYELAGLSYAGDYTNQVIAGNGRIFFNTAENRINYYNPVNEQVIGLGSLITYQTTGDQLFYKLKIGPDGYLYGTTQSNNYTTSLLKLNPSDLTYQTFTNFGSRTTALTYGYSMELDPPYAYVCVGQNEWGLWAVNTSTGVKTKLAESRADGAYISFNNRPGGIVATVRYARQAGDPASGTWVNHIYYSDDYRQEYFWVCQGVLTPAPPSSTAPTYPTYTTINFGTLPTWLSNPMPEIDLDTLTDDTGGSYAFSWRANAQSQWQTANFSINYAEPVALESLNYLSDGTFLGNAEQYNGWFRYNPTSDSLSYFGQHGPSKPTVLEVDSSTVYFSGYPKAHLWEYNPTASWTSTRSTELSGDSNLNPECLGNFAASGVHYPYYLREGSNGRIYMAGRLERSDDGAGVGYYVPSTDTFAGHNTNLSTLNPRGFIILPNNGTERIILSTELRDGVSDLEAKLIVYDMDLVEQERLTVEEDLSHTGCLYNYGDQTKFISMIPGTGTTRYYLYDFSTEQIVSDKTLTGEGSEIIYRSSDDTHWIVIDGKLVELDIPTFTFVPKGTLSGSLADDMDKYIWVGTTFYGVNGAEIVKATDSGLTDTPYSAYDWMLCHWRFNENTGTTAYSSGSLTNDGSLLYGATWLANGIEGTGIDSNGSDARIHMSPTVGDESNYSIILWVKTTNTTLNRLAYWEYGSGVPAQVNLTIKKTGDFSFLHEDNVSGNGAYLNFTNSGSDALNDGNWHMIAVVRDDSDYELYIDGELKDTTTATVGTCSVSYARMCNLYTGGSMDDVRLYETSLTAEQIAYLYHNIPGLISHWQFNETSGTSAADNGSAGNTATLMYGAVFDDEAGKYDGAVSISNGNHRVEMTPSSIGNLSQFSISTWVKVASSGSGIVYWENDTGSVGQMNLSIQSNGGIQFLHEDTSAGNAVYLNMTASTNRCANDDKWHHIVMVRDSPDYILYFDGIPVDTTNSTQVSTCNYNYARAGGLISGKFDDLRLYDTALTNDDIICLYGNFMK